MAEIEFIKKPLETIKKKPIIIVVFVGALLALLFLASRAKSQQPATETASEYTPADATSGGSMAGMVGQSQAETLSAAGSMVQAGDEKITSLLEKYQEDTALKFQNLDMTNQGMADTIDEVQTKIIDKMTTNMDSITSKFDTLDIHFDDKITNIESKIDTKTDSLDNKIQNITQTTAQTTQSQPIPARDTANELYLSQVVAYQTIKNLGDQWTKKKNAALADKIISPAEQKALDVVHNQAEQIGIKAGFGAGGTSGAARVIPDAVKKAVNGG